MAGERFGVTFEGGEELLKELQAAGLNTKKTMSGAVRKGGRVIADAANARAKAITSRAGKCVALRVRTRSGWAVASIYPAKGKRHLVFFETGTKPGWRWARKKGPFKFRAGNRLIVTRLIKHPGIRPNKWLQPAFNAVKNKATQVVGEAYRAAIEEHKVESGGSE
jgi:HK97 gp10 family phage protein